MLNQTPSTNLVIDIGNTRTKVALFRSKDLVKKEVWEKLDVRQIKDLSYNQNVQNVILSSTAVVPKEVEKFLQKNFNYLHLTNETPLPIQIQYDTPETLGQDRIAAAVGAWSEYPSENVLIIDAGTCITLDVINANGVFLGGNISPGIEMRLQAMHHFTAKLPHVKTTNGHLKSGDYLGSSTEKALRNGGELGALMEIKAFIQHCRRRFRPLRVIFTGGSADFFVKNLKTKIFAHSNLVLVGLNQILKFNVDQPEGF